MREWDAARVADAAGARLIAGPSRDAAPARGAASPATAGEPGPRGASIDSRAVRLGDLFVGLRGERVDGGEYAARALAAGAWGALVAPEHADKVFAGALAGPGGAVLVHPDPLAGLQALARAWRRELGQAGAKVVAITGSTGKTSTKDILAALLAASGAEDVPGERAPGLRTVASPENFNTEIGLPLAVLAAPAGTEALVLELAMRGAGQIARLTEIAAPDVGVIVNVGPVHLELLGSLEAIAAAKAELIAGLAPGKTVVVPVDEPLLEPHRRADVRTLTFGAGGDVAMDEAPAGAGGVAILDRTALDARARTHTHVEAQRDTYPTTPEASASPADEPSAQAPRRILLRPSFAQRHNLTNLLAAVAAARALGVTPGGDLDVRFSALRGERVALPGGVTLLDDCYNANPMSMRAAIDDLTETAPARRIAVLGDMLELGPAAGPSLHREVGAYAAERGVDVLVTVGPLAASIGAAFPGETHSVADADAAAELLGVLLRDRDTVLVKGSRGVGLERVAQALARERHGSPPGSDRSPARTDPFAGRPAGRR